MLSSYAFCLRDDRGDIIHAEGTNIDNATSIETVLEASRHYMHMNYNQVIIQIDSMLLKKKINRGVGSTLEYI